ncbi:MAG: pyridoxal phosphate-dependent aminotransferase [Acidobacteria bacterium]|nr:pyridoxal phosphate-dependent aminotransferase [Acidobacteriota bacterium]
MTGTVSSRVRLLRPTAVNSILAEVRKAQAEGHKLVSLMRGEPDFRTPPHIVEAAEQAIRKGRTGYPDNRGELPLRDAVAQKLQRENGLTYNPATEILITTGATFGIYAALMALLEPGDEVLLPEPIYDAYRSPIALAGAVVRTVPCQIVHGRFTLTRHQLEAAITPRTRILLLNTPWNPTGTVFNGPELESIAAFVQQHNLVLLSDEIYEAITFDPHAHISPASLLRDRSILINSFSKTYAMTGWRIGYCAGPADCIQAMFLVLQQSSRGPATFVQDAAVVALNASQQCVADMREEYARRRALVHQSLDGINGCRILNPEGGFFSMADVRSHARPSEEIRRRLMLQHGVVVVHGSAYGPAGEGTLRVSFASGGDTLQRGLECLRQGLAAL